MTHRDISQGVCVKCEGLLAHYIDIKQKVMTTQVYMVMSLQEVTFGKAKIMLNVKILTDALCKNFLETKLANFIVILSTRIKSLFVGFHANISSLVHQRLKQIFSPGQHFSRSNNYLGVSS